MAIELTPLLLPASADRSYLADFGREVKGVSPFELTPVQFAEIHDALYKASSSVIWPWLHGFEFVLSPSMVPSCSETLLSRRNSSVSSQR